MTRIIWGKLFRKSAREATEATSLGADLRLFLLVSSRAEAGGHACFDDGELVSLLPRLNKTTGELRRYTDRHIRNLISAGVDGGLYAPASNTRCVVLPMHVWKVEVGYRPRPCETHGHNLSWNGSEWVDPTNLLPSEEQLRQALARHYHDRKGPPAEVLVPTQSL